MCGWRCLAEFPCTPTLLMFARGPEGGLRGGAAVCVGWEAYSCLSLSGCPLSLPSDPQTRAGDACERIRAAIVHEAGDLAERCLLVLSSESRLLRP